MIQSPISKENSIWFFMVSPFVSSKYRPHLKFFQYSSFIFLHVSQEQHSQNPFGRESSWWKGIYFPSESFSWWHPQQQGSTKLPMEEYSVIFFHHQNIAKKRPVIPRTVPTIIRITNSIFRGLISTYLFMAAFLFHVFLNQNSLVFWCISWNPVVSVLSHARCNPAANPDG